MKVNKNLKKLSKLRKERLKPNGCKNHHLQEYQEIFSKQLNSFLKNNISDQRIFKQYQKAIDVFFISKVCRQDLNVSKNNFINLKQFILENKN
ncbi:MAG: hypothetical protein PHU32_04180, partial [Candidatus ainarchaeum sp.]|nr:hypothetical protein [Candidatus ainarchaeum sp.]